MEQAKLSCENCKYRFLVIIAALLASTTVFAQQFLPVKGIVNARDLGGYPVQDGRTVRDSVLLRAAHLADATDEDLAFLASLPVVKVMDFRTEPELSGKQNRIIPGAEYLRLPMDPGKNSSDGSAAAEIKQVKNMKKFDLNKIIVYAAFNEKAQKMAQEMYFNLLFEPECQAQYAEFFRQVVNAEQGGILYHCTQGKDRTGIASALLLSALGASRETIVFDFDATNKVYEKDMEKLIREVKFLRGTDKEIAVVKAFIGCSTENFLKALERVDAEYGSLEGYLEKALGVTEADREVLKTRYLK